MTARTRPARAAGLAMLLGSARAVAGPDAAPGKVDEAIEELFLGEAVYPQDALELQLTGGLTGARAAGVTETAAELELELGLTDRLQLAAAAPLVWRSARSAPAARRAGIGNPELELLYNPLSDRARGVAVSVGLGVMFPAPSDAGEGAWGAEAIAVAYKVLGGVHVNLAVAAELELPIEAAEEREVGLAAALGVFTPVGRWVPVVELRAASGEAPVAMSSVGMLWHPAGEVEIGAALQLGLDARSIGGILTATVELELAD